MGKMFGCGKQRSTRRPCVSRWDGRDSVEYRDSMRRLRLALASRGRACWKAGSLSQVRRHSDHSGRTSWFADSARGCSDLHRAGTGGFRGGSAGASPYRIAREFGGSAGASAYRIARASAAGDERRVVPEDSRWTGVRTSPAEGIGCLGWRATRIGSVSDSARHGGLDAGHSSLSRPAFGSLSGSQHHAGGCHAAGDDLSRGASRRADFDSRHPRARLHLPAAEHRGLGDGSQRSRQDEGRCDGSGRARHDQSRLCAGSFLVADLYSVCHRRDACRPCSQLVTPTRIIDPRGISVTLLLSTTLGKLSSSLARFEVSR